MIIVKIHQSRKNHGKLSVKGHRKNELNTLKERFLVKALTKQRKENESICLLTNNWPTEHGYIRLIAIATINYLEYVIEANTSVLL